MGFEAVEMTPMAAVRALRALSGAIRGVLGWGFWLAPSETRLVDQKPHLEPRNPNSVGVSGQLGGVSATRKYGYIHVYLCM